MDLAKTQGPLSIVMVAACPFPANHGGAASIREMSDALVKLGHRVHIVTYPVREEIPIGDVIVHRVSAPFLRQGKVKIGPSWEKFVYNPLMMARLVSVVRRNRIDVIHAHNYEGAMIGWIAKLLTRRPMLYNAVNTMSDELPSYNFIRPRGLAVLLARILDFIVPRSGDVVTAVSDSLRDTLVSGGVAKDKVFVVPAGVNLDMFEGGDGAAVRAEHGLGNAPLVMYTGALEEFQRIDYLLRAMREVSNAVPAAKLMIVGNALNEAQKAKHLSMAAELGLEDRLIFVDSVSLRRLPDYLAAADVAVVPRPDCPGHPVKLLNYMAAGRPIVSFAGSGKHIEHLHNGWLAADHDHQALGKGIVALLGDPKLSAELGSRARSTIENTLDWKTLVRGIEVLYRALLAPGQRVDTAQFHRYIRESYR